jgi:DNA repair exonuclease SbcCD ATPase subunit
VAKLKGYENRWLMPLIVGCTGLSVAFNVWHSPKADYLTRSVVALPPILLFASFKMWIWKIEQDTKRQEAIISIDELNERFTRLQLDLSDFEREADQKRQRSQNKLDQLAQHRDTLQAEIDNLMTAQSDIEQGTYRGNVTDLNAARQSQMEQRRMELLPLLDSDLTQKQLAERFDVTPQTIRRDIKALKDDGYLNDDGTRKQGSFDRLIDTIPLDQTGKDALRKSADHFTNSQKGDVS